MQWVYLLHEFVQNIANMKKLTASLLFISVITFSASAQKVEERVTDKKAKVETKHTEAKVKKTTTPKQKVHNVIHPKHKKYSGVKMKKEVKKD